MFEMDLAASVQKVTEDAMLKIARHVHRETGLDNLCLAGGAGKQSSSAPRAPLLRGSIIERGN